MAHRIANSEIRKELRPTGIFIRTVLPYYKDSTFRLFNRFIRAFEGGKVRHVKCERFLIQRRDGSIMKVAVYSSKTPHEEKTPGILWTHGGGYCIGDPDMDIWTLEEFIEASGCTVIAPYYTLAIEKPYPAALEDCYDALLWMKDNAGAFNIDTSRLMVAGSSAGGGLTAALCIYARDRKEVKIAFQMPIYPMLDDRMITASSQDNDAPVWNTKSNSNAWKLYLGHDFQKDHVSPYAAPGRLEDFAGLPPAYTFVGSLEPFRDETIAYFENLKKAGVDASCDLYEGAFHGFDVVCHRSDVARQAHSRLLEHFRYACENFKAEQES